MPEEGDTVQIVFPTEDENQTYAVQSVGKEDTDKTADPEVKYLRTPNGKEIKPDKEEILIIANDDVTYIKINEKSGVEIITDKAVQVTSGGSVTVNSGDTIDITSKGKFTAKPGNKFQITADQKLETESKQTLEIKCKDNAVKLESGGKGVDISSGKAKTGASKAKKKGMKNRKEAFDNAELEYKKECVNGRCFTGDMLVYTRDGYKHIKEIQKGDGVYSRNAETGEIGIKKVEEVFCRTAHTIYHVWIDGKEDI